MKIKLILSVLALVVLYFVFFFGKNPGEVFQSASPSASSTSAHKLSQPISGAKDRVTKKPFGIYITPKDSPVQPEKFTGYHTGVDFETTEKEQNTDVQIYAICDGPLLQKRSASGYGGVVVQSCTLDGSPITVVYGHLRLSSVSAAVNQQISAGDKLAVLGTGYSSETDGERKHLHLGIHKGSAVNITGYVQAKSELAQWVDFGSY